MNITKQKTDASMPAKFACIPRADAVSSGVFIKVSRAELGEMQVMAWNSYFACDEALEGLLTMLDDTLKTLISGTLDQACERHKTAKFILHGALLKHAELSDALARVTRFQGTDIERFRKESEPQS